LKKSSADAANAQSSFRENSSSYSTHHHQPTQCFLCAICRQESFGYVRYRELETRMSQLTVSCSNCELKFKLSELRQHSDVCQIDRDNKTDRFATNHRLSDSQAQALQKAQKGQNRSTFQCPFCPRAK